MCKIYKYFYYGSNDFRGKHKISSSPPDRQFWEDKDIEIIDNK